MAVLLAVGIIVGGGAAYVLGIGLDAGAATKDMARGFVEEDERTLRHAPSPLLSLESDGGGVLSVAARRKIAKRPQIALIIDDIGLNRRAFSDLVQMDGPLTFSILPYAPDAQYYADAAARAGHGVMLHLPMAPEGYDRADSAGPGTLRLADDAAGLRERLTVNLSRFTGYVGVNNHMGSGLSADSDSMEVILAALEEQGLFFIDSVTTGETQVPGAAQALGQTYFHRDVFLDSDYSETAAVSIRQQLDELERIALEQGHAVAIGHPYTTTVEALEDWTRMASARGFDLVTASDFVKSRKYEAEQKRQRASTMARLR